MTREKEADVKLSEAIRLGAMIRPQAFTVLFQRAGGSCALGAAVEASSICTRERFIVTEGSESTVDVLVAYLEIRRALMVRFPVLKALASCPVTGECPVECQYYSFGKVRAIIEHLNDDHRWTREQIADWIETVEAAVEADAPTPAETEEAHA
jgi:hypothetical protein